MRTYESKHIDELVDKMQYLIMINLKLCEKTNDLEKRIKELETIYASTE